MVPEVPAQTLPFVALVLAIPFGFQTIDLSPGLIASLDLSD